MAAQKPLCLKCKHYKVTHDPKAPRGCNFYGFNSPNIPSIVVLKETGSPCLAFEERISESEKRRRVEERWKNS